MLLPEDYDTPALHQYVTRQLMRKIEFLPGGPEYDVQYPDGIPTCVEIEHARLGRLSSGLIKYPAGHARCTSVDWSPILREKFRRLATLGGANPVEVEEQVSHLADKSPTEVRSLYE